jgi:cyclopropane fatty-acyl-phospholipid synthase-like methyltransferase
MSPLYTFLRYCERSSLPKEILDCGAGGEDPPLYIFHSLGCTSHGVEISEEQLKKARGFCDAKGIELNIRRGDMRTLPFEGCSFSFVYSYDTVFHMPKG